MVCIENLWLFIYQFLLILIIFYIFFLLSLKETKDVISWLQIFKIRHVVIRYLPVILIFSGGQRKEAFQDMGQFKEREEGTGGH